MEILITHIDNTLSLRLNINDEEKNSINIDKEFELVSTPNIEIKDTKMFKQQLIELMSSINIIKKSD
jgi:hypothetical protein